MSKQKNVKNLIMNVLPDNRPVTSLQIVEDYDKCPKNFIVVHRTYDQDSDADLWRENNILFGKRTSRYLCLSKSEGLADYIVESLKICGERELPGEGFSLLSRTADREHKAWRKKQIAYKLSKRGTITQAITDIILCSKLKIAPQGFNLAGEINGISVCYKLGPVTHRPPPSIPTKIMNDKSFKDIENGIHYVNIARSPTNGLQLHKQIDNGYEIITPNYKISEPQLHMKSSFTLKCGTLGYSTVLDGVPFNINPKIKPNQDSFDISKYDFKNKTTAINNLQYDFKLERQILCTVPAK